MPKRAKKNNKLNVSASHQQHTEDCRNIDNIDAPTMPASYEETSKVLTTLSENTTDNPASRLQVAEEIIVVVRQKVDDALSLYKSKGMAVELWNFSDNNQNVLRVLKDCKVAEYELVVIHMTGTVILKMADEYQKCQQQANGGYIFENLQRMGLNKDNCSLLRVWGQSAVDMTCLRVFKGGAALL